MNGVYFGGMFNFDKSELRGAGEVVSIAVGVGWLLLPAAVVMSGWWWGLGSGVIIGLISLHTLLMWLDLTSSDRGDRDGNSTSGKRGQAGGIVGDKRFFGLIEGHLGPVAGYLGVGAWLIFIWGAIVAYLQVIPMFFRVINGGVVDIGTVGVDAMASRVGISLGFLVIAGLFLLGSAGVNYFRRILWPLLMLLLIVLVVMGLIHDPAELQPIASYLSWEGWRSGFEGSTDVFWRIFFQFLIPFTALTPVFTLWLFAFFGLPSVPELLVAVSGKIAVAKRAVWLGYGITAAIYSLFIIAMIRLFGSLTPELAILGVNYLWSPIIAKIALGLVGLVIINAAVANAMNLQESLMKDFKLRFWESMALSLLPPFLVAQTLIPIHTVIVVTAGIFGGLIGLLLVLAHGAAAKNGVWSAREAVVGRGWRIAAGGLFIFMIAGGLDEFIRQLVRGMHLVYFN